MYLKKKKWMMHVLIPKTTINFISWLLSVWNWDYHGQNLRTASLIITHFRFQGKGKVDARIKGLYCGTFECTTALVLVDCWSGQKLTLKKGLSKFKIVFYIQNIFWCVSVIYIVYAFSIVDRPKNLFRDNAYGLAYLQRIFSRVFWSFL